MQDELESKTIQFEQQQQTQQRANYETTLSRDGLTPKGSIEILSEADLTTYFNQLKKIAGYPDSSQITKLNELIITDRAIGGSMASVKPDLKSIFNILYCEKHKLYNPTLQSRNVFKRGLIHLKNLLKKSEPHSSSDSFLSQYPYAYITASDIYGNDTNFSLEPTNNKNEHDNRYNFDTLFRQVIFRFTDIVALLPASESHHHSYPGGLLAHSLEVANTAYNFSKSQNLKSIGLNDIEILRKKRWQYAAFICGLLHDIGKVITDMVIIGEDKNGNQTKWNPLLSDATTYFKEKRIVKYYIDMNSSNKYLDTSGRFKRHENVASIMLYRILTPEAIDYITTSPDTGYGLLEEILNVLNGKSSNEYLKKALFLGESTSVYNSFIKVRSSFHINDHRDSDADMLMSALRDIRHTKEIMNCTYVIGGIVFLKYPETITYLQNHIKRNAIKSTSVNGYSPGELVQRLASSTYIKPASEDVVGLKIQLRKLFISKNPREPDYMDNFGSPLDVVMLEHPTHMFGNGLIPESIPGTIIINDRHKVIFETEEDCYEIITSKEEYEAAVAEKIRLRNAAKGNDNVGNDSKITPEELEAQKEILKRTENSKQKREQKRKLEHSLPTSGRIVVHNSVDDIVLSKKNVELKNQHSKVNEQPSLSSETVVTETVTNSDDSDAPVKNSFDSEPQSSLPEYTDYDVFDREYDNHEPDYIYGVEQEAPIDVNALLNIPQEPVFSQNLNLEDLDTGVTIVTPETATNKSVTAKGSSGAKDIRQTVSRSDGNQVNKSVQHKSSGPNLKGLSSLSAKPSVLSKDDCIQQLLKIIKVDTNIDGQLLSQEASQILNKNQPLLLASCAFGLVTQKNNQTQISEDLIKSIVAEVTKNSAEAKKPDLNGFKMTQTESLFVEACEIPQIKKNIIELQVIKKIAIRSSHFKDKNLSEDLLLTEGLISTNGPDFKITSKGLNLLGLNNACSDLETEKTSKLCSTASQSDSVRLEALPIVKSEEIEVTEIHSANVPTIAVSPKRNRTRKKKVQGMQVYTPQNRTITKHMHEIVSLRQKVRTGEFIKVANSDIEKGYIHVERKQMKTLIKNSEDWEAELIESICDELFTVFAIENEETPTVKIIIPNKAN
ncbi:TraI domain-containing protein [Aliivibrio fischeri]|uniref:TraI domain-containing protein n=1 Tax=Aliivibrio fischeri TaxID=668 RepID=UPI0012D894D0|nr:TraI domain-containing protein [Aliivibrio fischeri]MUJ20388.1 hypothetical protein [Aliivibrio fischeri]